MMPCWGIGLGLGLYTVPCPSPGTVREIEFMDRSAEAQSVHPLLARKAWLVIDADVILWLKCPRNAMEYRCNAPAQGIQPRM